MLKHRERCSIGTNIFVETKSDMESRYETDLAVS